MRKGISVLLVLAFCLSSIGISFAETAADNKYIIEEMEADGFYRVINPNGGARLSYVDIELLEVEEDGFVYAFKDLNKNGELDPYEDWRLTAEERAADLSAQLPLKSIAGLMLFSAHTGPGEGGIVTPEQYNYLVNDGVRAVLYARSTDFATAIKWANGLNAVVEANDPFGIPVNMSSDPRNSAQGSVADDLANTTYASGWPSNLGLSATFNPEWSRLMGEIISKEYRALGIGTALSPQIDLATEPRWSRFSGTYGEDVQLASDIAASHVSGMQSTWVDGEDVGWGKGSIIAMVKHFPGDGAAEAGREAHNNYGKYNVYPGDALADHVAVFAATMNLDTKTGQAKAVMPSYSIAYGVAGPIGQPVGSGYSSYKLVDLLRGELGFTGVICSDWGITARTVWGVENKTVVERHYLAIMNGLDMFGGNNAALPVLDAYDVGSIVKTVRQVVNAEGVVTTEAVDGAAVMDEAFFQIGYRVLYNEFVLGLFDDAFLCYDESIQVLQNEEYSTMGYTAQQESVVLLKNTDALIAEAGSEMKTVYIPMQYDATKAAAAAAGEETLQAHILGDWANVGFEQLTFDGVIKYSFDLTLLSQYFNVVTDSLQEETNLNAITEEDIVRRTDFDGVDFALVGVTSPRNSTGYYADKVNLDPAAGPIDNGYYPISLTYGDYYADPEVIRERPMAVDPDEELKWIAAGGEVGYSRYYGGKTTEGAKKEELALILNTRETIGDLPLVVYIAATNPFCAYEFEPSANAIVVGMGVSSNAVLDIISGKVEPKGLLPMQLPIDMITVEQQYEDLGHDMECYVDANGNTYDFAFGLNWSGVISDERTETYAK